MPSQLQYAYFGQRVTITRNSAGCHVHLPPYCVRRLNHGIGFNTAAIELLLPTYGREARQGKVRTHLALNPHPTLIPAIESGWVDQIHCLGSEVGMEDYVAARSHIFFTDLTDRCGLTARSARRHASMPATCSSDRHSRSISKATDRG